MMQFHATTIVLVKRSADDICIGGDGQVTMGEHAIMKNNAKKVRKTGPFPTLSPSRRSSKRNWKSTEAI